MRGQRRYASMHTSQFYYYIMHKNRYSAIKCIPRVGVSQPPVILKANILIPTLLPTTGKYTIVLLKDF